MHDVSALAVANAKVSSRGSPVGCLAIRHVVQSLAVCACGGLLGPCSAETRGRQTSPHMHAAVAM
jgi:hypothetical protein